VPNLKHSSFPSNRVHRMVGLIQHLRKVAFETYRPANDGVGAAIDDGNLLQVWQVHIDVRACGCQLERFRMRSQFEFVVESLICAASTIPIVGAYSLSLTGNEALLRCTREK
jgi:hypothetical protein